VLRSQHEEHEAILRYEGREAVMKKRTAIFVVVSGALAAWLVEAATSGVRPVRPIVTAPPKIDLRGAALVAEIERIRDRLRPTAMPEHGRDLFQFAPRRAAAAPFAAVETPAPERAPAAPAAPVEPPFKLIGIAEDSGTRTAILSSPGQLLMVKDGELVSSTFRVTGISAEAVELTATTDGTVLRLALK